jgi:hypothetical protein
LLGVVSFIKRSNAWFLKVLIHIMSNDESHFILNVDLEENKRKLDEVPSLFRKDNEKL